LTSKEEVARKPEKAPAVTALVKGTALVLAFLSGGAVMVVELGAARVLTPAFGGSISVWAVIIAVTMLALSVGYAVGGRWADRNNGIDVAVRAAVVGSALCAAIPFVRRPLLSWTLEWSSTYGALTVSLVLIGPALFFFGQVSPALIRGLARNDGLEVGTTAGRVYAISTLGSLLGTLAGAWMFLYLPLKAGFVGTALAVILPVPVLRKRTGGIAVASLTALLGYILVFPEAGLAAVPMNGNLYQLVAVRQSHYGEVRVVEQDGRFRYLLANGITQGGINISNGRSVFGYTDALLGVPYMYKRGPTTALLIGLGPGIVARSLEQLNVDTDVVELDEEVIRTARELFRFKGKAVAADGRRFLQTTDKRWDLIVVDVYVGAVPPWQLFTKEAFELYRAHLVPGGVVALNLMGSHSDPEQRPALEAVVSTARSVFPVADVYPYPGADEGESFRNIFLAASDHARLEPLHPGKPEEAGNMAEALARTLPVSVGPGRILTDASSPLAPMVSRTAEHLRRVIHSYLPSQVLLY